MPTPQTRMRVDQGTERIASRSSAARASSSTAAPEKAASPMFHLPNRMPATTARNTTTVRRCRPVKQWVGPSPGVRGLFFIRCPCKMKNNVTAIRHCPMICL